MVRQLTECAKLIDNIVRTNKKLKQSREQCGRKLTDKKCRRRDSYVAKNESWKINQKIRDKSIELAEHVVDEGRCSWTWAMAELDTVGRLNLWYGKGSEFSRPHGHIIINVDNCTIIGRRRINEDRSPMPETRVKIR